MANEEFAKWIDEEIEQRGWTRSKLASRAGLSSGTLSNIMLGKRRLGENVARSIATALGYPPEIVFRAAGLLPSRSDKDELTEKIVHLVNQMDDVDKQWVFDFVELVARRSEQRNLVEEFKAYLADLGPDQTEEITRELYALLPKLGGKRLK